MKHDIYRKIIFAGILSLTAACATTGEKKSQSDSAARSGEHSFLTPRNQPDSSQSTVKSEKGKKSGKKRLSLEEELVKAKEVAAELRRIEIQRRLGEAGSLREEFSARIARDPGDLLAKLYLAWVDYPSENAGTQINALAKMNPEEPWLFTALARIYMTWPGFLELADQEVEKALALSSSFTPALAAKAEILRMSGKTEEAVALFKEVLARDHQCFEAFIGLSQAEESQGNLKAAHEALDSALAIDDGNPFLLKRQVEILLKEGDERGAVPLYGKLIGMYPADMQLRLSRGHLLLSLGEKNEAAEDLEACMAAAPTHEIAGELAGIYRELQKPQDEVRALEAWIRFDEGATAANYRRLYDLLRDSGDTEGAENYLVKAIAAASSDMELRRLLASSQEERGDILHAMETYKRAAEEGDRASAGEFARLEKAVGLSKRKLSGSASRIHNSLFLLMQKALKARQKNVPGLAGGTISVRANIGEGGVIKSVEILNDTISDSYLKAYLYFTLLNAEIPGGNPRGVTFEIDLTPEPRTSGRRNRRK